jgi:hypothetical protein
VEARKLTFAQALEANTAILDESNTEEYFVAMQAQVQALELASSEIHRLKKSNHYWQAGFSLVAVLAIWLIAMRFV